MKSVAVGRWALMLVDVADGVDGVDGAADFDGGTAGWRWNERGLAEEWRG